MQRCTATVETRISIASTHTCVEILQDCSKGCRVNLKLKLLLLTADNRMHEFLYIGCGDPTRKSTSKSSTELFKHKKVYLYLPKGV